MEILELNGSTNPKLCEEILDRIADIDRAVFGDSAWGRTAFAENVVNDYDFLTAAVDKTDGSGQARDLKGCKVCGYALLRCFDDAELIMIAVDPLYRRRGIGEMLLEELISEAKKREAAGIFLEVRESNEAARAMYEKAGFVVTGVRRDYYHAPRENAVIMQLQLQ